MSDFRWEHDPLLYHHCGLTGYTGVDPHSVLRLSRRPARRVQIGERGQYKGALAQLPSGELIAPVCSLAQPGFPVSVFRSRDEGCSWEPLEYGPALHGKEIGLTCLRSGALLMTLEDPHNTVACSEDGGLSWHVTQMRPLLPEFPEGSGLTTVRSPIEAPDGTVTLLRCWGHYEGSAAGSPQSRVWLFHSLDGGRTWPEIEEIPTWDDSFPLFVEADFLQLPDGRVLATSRFEYDHHLAGTDPPWAPRSVPNDHAAGHMVLLESEDLGRTWVGPRDFLNYSEVQGQLTLLADGRIVCTYTNYHLPFGVAAVVSSDGGRSWDLDHPYQLAISNSVCTGWPTTRQLPDSSLLTVYALEPYHLEPEQPGRTVFQCVRWNLG